MRRSRLKLVAMFLCLCVLSGCASRVARLRRDAPIEELIAAMQSEGPDRKRAVSRIGSRGEEAKVAVPLLIELVGDPDLQYSAITSVKNLGPLAAEAAPALIRAIGNPAVSSSVRSHAAEALASIGQGAIPALREGLEGGDVGQQIWCAAALARVEGPDSPQFRFLAERLTDGSPEARDEVLLAAMMLRPVLAPLVPALIELLGDPESPPPTIARVLALVGPCAWSAMPGRPTMLHNPRTYQQTKTILAIESIGIAQAKPAIPALIQALKRTNAKAEERQHAVMMLGVFGRGSRPALAALIAAMKDESELVRASAAVAIGKICSTEPADL